MNPFSNAKVIEIDPLKKDLFLRVIDGYYSHRLFHFLHHVYDYRYCTEMLKWCVENRITGRALEEILKSKKWSHLETAKWIIMQTNRDRETKPVIVGRDWKSS